ncbi:MAG: SgrR family transcriptional regulator, partial [Thermodesulfobacteriota bacterium]|nr:SgrR family transcriptional regulator [Thermodesulfobacteriota bacterium]
MAEKNGKGRHIDYIFGRYPLWVRYSKLPGKLGPGPWCVFQRLLELMERFGSSQFHYSIERLIETSGVSSRLGIRKILRKLELEGLIKYESQQGRGKESKFEVILPINAPLSEEDVYHIHPRLRSKSYQRKIESGDLQE